MPSIKCNSLTNEIEGKGSESCEFSGERKAKRPPLRKYIRKEGVPGQQRMVVQVVEQKPAAEISVASLRKKFGLSESTIGRVIRDAEKQGKIKRVVSGSDAWALTPPTPLL